MKKNKLIKRIVVSAVMLLCVIVTVMVVCSRMVDLICLMPDMSSLTMDMLCGEIPSEDNDSIILAFAGAFTGTMFDKGHFNIVGDHVSGGIRFKGYRCKRNTGAFTWLLASGPQFFYDNYSSASDNMAKEGGMCFAQEMMIHNGKALKISSRPTYAQCFKLHRTDANVVYEDYIP